MENKKIWTLIGIILISLQALLQIVATVVVIWLNMLPNNYVVVLILAMVLLLEAILLFTFVPIKNRIRLWRRIVSCVLSGAIIIASLVVAKMGLDAYKLLDDVTGETSNIRNSYVLVLNESPVRSLMDTKELRYGAVGNYDVDHTQQLLAAVEQAIESTLNLSYYEQPASLVDALYSQQIDVIIMNEASVSLLVEQTGYEDFLSRVRIVHTMAFEGEGQADNIAGIASSSFVMYISGSDTRNAKLNVSRSDVNILAVINPTTKQVLLINTPRDAYVPNSAGKGSYDKLTHCGLYGVDCTMEVLGNLYGVDVNHYARINFSGFEKLIDAIGGVTIYSDESFTSIHGMYFAAGENVLDGKKTLEFSRERFHVTGGDNGRGKNQMKVLKEVIEKISSSKTLISNYADIIKSLEGMFVTSIEAEEIGNLVKMQLNDMSAWNVQSYSVSGTGGYGETYSAPGQELYITKLNDATVAYATQLIERVMSGEQLAAEDMVMPKQ